MRVNDPLEGSLTAVDTAAASLVGPGAHRSIAPSDLWQISNEKQVKEQLSYNNTSPE